MAEPTNHELSERIAVLEERMKTLQSDLQGTLERFLADTADWKTDMTKRENRLLLAILGGIAVATAAPVCQPDSATHWPWYSIT